MSTRSQLLRAVLAAPDQDVPRLVYADYCDDQGDPDRAALIRAQCEHARLPAWEPRSIELLHQIRVLLARHGRRWLAELGELPGLTWGSFHRGFVHAVEVPTVEGLLDHADELPELAPLEHVTFSAAQFLTDNDLRDPRCRSLSWIRGLRLTDRYEFQLDQLEMLLGSSLVSELHTLDLTNLGVENAGARAIAKASHMHKLRKLDLTNGFVGEEGVAALAGARHLSSLEHLVFNSYGGGYVEDPFVTDDAIEGLVSEGSQLTGLVSLGLGGNSVGDESVRLLLETSHLPRLQSLELKYCELTSGAFEAADGPARWRSLQITGVRLRTEAVRRMIARPQLEQLVCLELEACNLDQEALQVLVTADFAPRLRSLNLSSNQFGAGGAEALAGVAWSELHTLRLARNNFDQHDVSTLASAQMPRLAKLDLSLNRIAALPELAQSSWASTLRRLNLERNQLGPATVPVLKALHGLTALELGHNPLTPDGVSALVRGAWPQLTDLGLESSGCGDEAVELAAEQPWIRQLLRLDLSACELTARALERLLRAGPLALRELHLDRNPDIAHAIPALGSGEALPALVLLSVSSCGLQAETMNVLVSSPLADRLMRIGLYGNRETEQTQQLLDRLGWGGGLGPDWISEGEVEDEY
jgi:uncharacterized protein (TIGR02996 family)